MPEKESNSSQNEDFSDPEIEIEPTEKLREFLRIPLRLEHTYLDEDIPSIVRVSQFTNKPDTYRFTDSLGDEYLVRLSLSDEERAYTKWHEKEYDQYNFLAFDDPNSNLPKKEIYRLNIEINRNQKSENELIEISYSRTKSRD